MQAGRLRYRIALQTNMPSQNAFGEEVDSWSTTATVWASIEPLSGREYLVARQEEQETTTRIRIRYRADVTSGMRATWTDPDGTAHVYDIQSVIHDRTALREIELMCVEVV